MKKQLVRATLVLEVPVGERGVIYALEDMSTAVGRCREIAEVVDGEIMLVKVSDTGKESRTKMGDVPVGTQKPEA